METQSLRSRLSVADAERSSLEHAVESTRRVYDSRVRDINEESTRRDQ
jgi:hypothetical protein